MLDQEFVEKKDYDALEKKYAKLEKRLDSIIKINDITFKNFFNKEIDSQRAQKRFQTIIKQSDKQSKELIEDHERKNELIHHNKVSQMSEMLSMIAHQWRQPLNIITTVANRLQLQCMKGNMDKDLFIKDLMNISDHSQDLSNVIDYFRNFFQTNEIKELESLDNIVNNTISIIQMSLKERNINLNVDLNSTTKIELYPNDIMQVVLSLIQNAEDALLDKKIENATINIKTISDNNSHKIIVQDNANGIPKEMISKIFQPYFSTKVTKDGTGLGLHLAKSIVEEHCSGVLSVISDENGSAFTIELFNEINKTKEK